MTAHPDPLGFSAPPRISTATDVDLHPNVIEQFWGYETRMNERPLTVASVLRFGSGFLAVVSSLAAVGLWLVPAQQAWSDGFVSTILATVLLITLAGTCANNARRGVDVRVQIDTRNGELREVVDAGLKGTVVVARYGMDAVRDVEIVLSNATDGFGQIHVEIDGYGTIPIADGAVSTLNQLRSRLAADCGIELTTRRTAEWSGPLVA